MELKNTLQAIIFTFLLIQINGQEEVASTNVFDILKGAVLGARAVVETLTRSANGVARGAQGYKQKICYNDLGCFSLDAPWFHPILRPVPPPDDPRNIETKFYFSNKLTRNQEISSPNFSGINNIRFTPIDKRSMLYVIIHGYISGSDAGWMQEMQYKLQSLGGQVMLVDWSTGATTNYFQAVSNTRVVAREIAYLLRELSTRYGISLKKLHLIGHSLGAQIAGLVGKNFTENKLHRITGLDPAQPGFEHLDSKVHLWRTDADFVDVIHTSARPFIPLLGFGMLEPVGHLDFYINGGAVQPFCLDIEEQGRNIGRIGSLLDLVNKSRDFIVDLIPCSHSLAITYFMDSLNDTCVLWGKRPLQSVQQSVLSSGPFSILKPIIPKDWLDCNVENCAPLGLKAFVTRARGSLYVNTNKKPPYCWNDKKVNDRLGKFLK